MKSLVTSRIRRHLLSLAIFSHGKSSNKLQDIYCGWLYFPMERRVINLLEDIYCRWLYFPIESCVIIRIRRHLLSFGKSCNKSY